MERTTNTKTGNDIKHTYTPIIGVPNLRVRDDGVVFGIQNKPIKFTGYKQSTTLVIDGKVRRVKLADIQKAAKEGLNLAVMCKFRKKSFKGVDIDALHQYNELSGNISMIMTAMLTKDSAPILEYFTSKVQNYITHFQYLEMDYDTLYDIIMDCIMELTDRIMTGQSIVVNLNGYLTRMIRQKIAVYYKTLK